MPKYVKNNIEYINELKNVFKKYKKEIQKIAFKYEENLVDDVINNCDRILEALNVYLAGDKNKAKIIVTSLIKRYIDDFFGFQI